MPSTLAPLSVEDARRLVTEAADTAAPNARLAGTRQLAKAAATHAVATTLARCGHLDTAVALLGKEHTDMLTNIAKGAAH